MHLQKLGTPKEGRLAARSGHAGEMLRIYERHLKTAEAQRELDELEALASSAPTEAVDPPWMKQPESERIFFPCGIRMAVRENIYSQFLPRTDEFM